MQPNALDSGRPAPIGECLPASPLTPDSDACTPNPSIPWPGGRSASIRRDQRISTEPSGPSELSTALRSGDWKRGSAAYGSDAGNDRLKGILTGT